MQVGRTSWRRTWTRTAAIAAGVVLVVAGSPVAASAHDHHGDDDGFVQTNLVSDVPGLAFVHDTNVSNPWGISFGVGAKATPLWVVNNKCCNPAAGPPNTTLYKGPASGPTPIGPALLTVGLPPVPTGTVFNDSDDPTEFPLPAGGQSRFIFDSLTGDVAAWAPGMTDAAVVFHRDGSSFTGLAIGHSKKTGSMLYITDDQNAVVRILDSTFTEVGSFTDRKLVAAGLVPYGVRVFGKKVFVTFAVPPDGTAGTITGAVDVFSLTGKRLKRLTTSKRLLGAWGMAIAPKHWGEFGGKLLVGNVDDGKINVFDTGSGHFRGTLRGVDGNALVNDGLWGISFGNGVIGTPRTLIIAAGINGYVNGLVAGIEPAPDNDDD